MKSSLLQGSLSSGTTRLSPLLLLKIGQRSKQDIIIGIHIHNSPYHVMICFVSCRCPSLWRWFKLGQIWCQIGFSRMKKSRQRRCSGNRNKICLLFHLVQCYSVTTVALKNASQGKSHNSCNTYMTEHTHIHRRPCYWWEHMHRFRIQTLFHMRLFISVWMTTSQCWQKMSWNLATRWTLQFLVLFILI